jgi:hypothetical protein
MSDTAPDGRANRIDHWICVALFVLVVVTQFNGKWYGIGDTRWYIPVALSLIEEGDTDLDEYRDIMTSRDYAVMGYRGHLYNFFPIGPSLIAVPFVYTLDRLAVHVFDVSVADHIRQRDPWRIESLIAVCIVAAAVVVMYRLARLFLTAPRAVLIALIFAYATSTWSTASLSLWMHGPSMLCLTLALYWLLRARENPRFLYAAAVPLFFSFVIRPTNSVPVALFSLYVLLGDRKRFPLFAATGLVTLLPLFLDSYAKSGRLLDHYYLSGGTSTHRLSFVGLAGTLVSPGRGLFVYSPVLLFSLVGLWIKGRRRQLGALDAVLVGTILIHWVSLSLFAINWWGGHSLGPRYFTDMNPFFAFYLIPLLQKPLGTTWIPRTLAYALLALLTLISGVIQWRSVSGIGVALWNAKPIDVNARPQRLWDWGDVPFLRGIQVIYPLEAPLPRASLWFAPHKVEYRFGEMIALRGHDWSGGAVQTGYASAVTLRLYWEALQPPDFDYSVFVHVVGADGEKAAQSDHAPGVSLDYPPTRWRMGDVIVDEHIIHLPAAMQPGDYYLMVGMYNWATGQRLPVRGLDEAQEFSTRLGQALVIYPPPPYTLYLPFAARPGAR